MKVLGMAGACAVALWVAPRFWHSPVPAWDTWRVLAAGCVLIAARLGAARRAR